MHDAQLWQTRRCGGNGQSRRPRARSAARCDRCYTVQGGKPPLRPASDGAIP
ncbi:hypothetical protein EG799_02710 [Aurantiacibacter spongiae]|uniref:Uncharacterized protein n=1 Tax=Aurantiacibacter spongiae TaxID=2488860 RepID=A0A3N5DJ12_9SPHN|nr:hypothetical protein EG799_02710 [Aurantiacibacter spongiae]